MHPNSIEIPLDLRADGSIEQSQIRVRSPIKKKKTILRCIRMLRLNC